MKECSILKKLNIEVRKIGKPLLPNRNRKTGLVSYSEQHHYEQHYVYDGEIMKDHTSTFNNRNRRRNSCRLTPIDWQYINTCYCRRVINILNDNDHRKI